MVTVEQFSRMVTAVHDAALEPARWADALTMVRVAVGGTGCGLILGGRSGRDVTHCSVPNDEAMRAYQAHFEPLDYVLDAVEKSAVGLVHDGGSLVALNPRSEFCADWLQPYGMDDGLFVKVHNSPRPLTFLIATERRDRPFGAGENFSLVNTFVPHLQRALRTESAINAWRDRDGADTTAGAIADSFSAPAAVVNGDLTVVYANNPMQHLLRCQATVLSHHGRIVLAASSAHTALRSAVAHAARGTGARLSASLRIQRSDPQTPLIAHVLPLGEANASQALLLVVDPEQRQAPPVQVLRQLFSLTATEAEVAIRLGRGMSLGLIAEDLSLSLATVKTHTQHIYDKTHTHRQAELVRLLLTVMP